MIFDDMLYNPTFAYIKLEPYTGSFNNRRYRIWTKYEEVEIPGEEKKKKVGHLMASVYPDEFCYEKTAEEAKTTSEFDFSEDGLELAKKFIEENILSDNNQ